MATLVYTDLQKNLKHNLFYNLLDGAFFGMGIGFASFVTIIPLFVSTMTDSAILIGLVPAIHSAIWQLPQLFVANWVSRQRRYKPMVMLITLQERLPFLGLGLVAWSMARLGDQTALVLTMSLLIWQGLGGGVAAAAWQSMIGKIFPARRRGTFYGAQASLANLFASLGAVAAGFLLDRLETPLDYMLCFLIAFVFLMFSWISMGQTREPEHTPAPIAADHKALWTNLRGILARDANFRWFLVMRALSQFAVMGSAFFTIYAVKIHQVSELEIGWMTGIFMGVQIIANPIMGWLGDRWSHRGVMEGGLIAIICSAILAWWAPSSYWFYLVFILTGIGGVATWTISLSMILEFGSEAERPAYIGLANTLIAPANIVAPLIGGWLADAAGFQLTFIASAIGGIAACLALHYLVRDPRQIVVQQQASPAD